MLHIVKSNYICKISLNFLPSLNYYFPYFCLDQFYLLKNSLRMVKIHYFMYQTKFGISDNLKIQRLFDNKMTLLNPMGQSSSNP